jgi:hypothetical protein
MLTRGTLTMGLLVAAIPCTCGVTMGFGPGEAAGSLRPTGADVRHTQANCDFKVVVWYRRADSLGTFKYEVYDVRKGEFTPDVEKWIATVRLKYPGYTALVRDVDLKREKGANEKLKVGSVVKRDLAVAAAIAGIGGGSSFEVDIGPKNSSQNISPRPQRQPRPPAVDRSFLNTSPPSFPVPVPYSRPHP